MLAARSCGPFHAMANIKQQKKRVGTAARERLQNLRYRSAVKTYQKRLVAAVDAGDSATIQKEHLDLVRLIDKAATKGALHKNTASRKKAQAARIAAGVAAGAE
jgi:small subunit ribosomal protein S20